MNISQELITNEILQEVIKRGASDIHFSVGTAPVLRIHDDLVSLDDRPIVTQDFMNDLVGFLLDQKQREQLDKEKEIVFAHDFDKNLRFKVNIFYQKNFLSATLRYVPTKIPTPQNLGLSQTIIDLSQLKSGLVIIAGPFGSGRSTTIASLIEQINRTRKEYIITIEDPVEYLFTNNQSIIEQREVGRDTNSFLDALNYFQEEDGDVLFIEEIYDPKVIPVVLEIARGSALVLTSLTADTAPKAIARILDSFQSFDQERVRDLLATSLKAVVCQKLVSKIGGGVMPVFEILFVNDAVKTMIAGGNIGQLETIIQTSKTEKMVSFEQSVAELARANVITREEALQVVDDKERLNSLLK